MSYNCQLPPLYIFSLPYPWSRFFSIADSLSPYSSFSIVSLSWLLLLLFEILLQDLETAEKKNENKAFSSSPSMHSESEPLRRTDCDAV